jgi:pimeloyl-ACP methyl ester carboxylesterase
MGAVCTIGGTFAVAEPASGPLLVAIHGGTYNHHYYDVGPASLLDIASANGLSIASLDRPNYGLSGPLPLRSNEAIAANAGAISTAIGDLWSQVGANYTGVVLIGHSLGSLVGVHIAAQPTSWPLLGLCADGFGQRILPPPEWDYPASDGGEREVNYSADVRKTILYGPAWSYAPAALALAQGVTQPMPEEEVRECYDGWLRDVLVLAPRITVPMYLGFAEFDRFWPVDDESVREFAQLFTCAASVETQLIRNVGHTVDHHFGGPAFHLCRLAFALACDANRLRPADKPRNHSVLN